MTQNFEHTPSDSTRKANGHADSISLTLDPADPYAAAKLYLADRHAHPNGPLLRHHRGDFYRHTGTHWVALEDAALRAESYAWMAKAVCVTDKGAQPFKPTARRTSDFLDALKAASHLGTDAAAPSWIPGSNAPLPADDLVPVQNGLLHLKSGALLPPTPSFFNTMALPFAYDPCAPEPAAWLDFLASVWPDDPEAIACLQEVMGYLVSGDRRQQKAFLVVGPPRSGKGTIAKVIRALVGAENAAGPTLGDLANNFGLAPLIGKSVAIIADARLSGRADAAAVTERLLSISGEDAITIDRKHREHWTGTLPTRFVVLTNELPKLTDASGALANRFVVLTMTQSFLGKEDHGLGGRVLAELPGILNWAIEGWRRLAERGRFVHPASSAEAIENIDTLSSPIKAFLKANCRVEPGAQVPCDALYKAWCDWCADQGRDKPGTAQSFGRDLHAVVPVMRTTRPRFGDDRPRCYEGIGLVVRDGPRWSADFELTRANTEEPSNEPDFPIEKKSPDRGPTRTIADQTTEKSPHAHWLSMLKGADTDEKKRKIVLQWARNTGCKLDKEERYLIVPASLKGPERTALLRLAQEAGLRVPS